MDNRLKAGPILLALLFLLAAFSTPLMAQQDAVKKKEKKKKNFAPNNAVLIAPVYTAQFPFGNVRDRFGFNSYFGLHLGYKIKKNWLLSVEGGFLFGTRVREGYVLSNIATSGGRFIGQSSNLVTVTPQEQGYSFRLSAGKVFPFSEEYPDAGILVMTGFGFLEHKIAINVKAASLPQLDRTYRKGYDRMCNGPMLSQFVGGIFLQRKKFVSFYGGLQLDVAFTQGRRAFDFYNQAPLNDKRIDLFLGIRLGWVIPVFLQSSEKEYFYY